jgi:phage protein D
MTWTSIVSESKRPEHRHFYAPGFDVRISGQSLPQHVLSDITEITYRDSLTEIDQFELTLNNWAPGARRFKYIGSETEKDLDGSDEKSLPFKLFEPCRKQVSVSLGYADRKLLMMTGNFTTMEPNFPSSGPPVLTVRGLNVLHQLRRKKYSYAWEKRTPSFIARNIATLVDGGKPRFPYKIEVDPNVEKKEASIPYVTQTDQTDVDFLLNFARQHGYELFAREFDDAGRPKSLFFGPGLRARAPVNYQLDWGRTLIDFKPSLTTVGQWKSLTVRGWDRTTQKPISEKVAFDDRELTRMNADMHEMIIECDPREDQVVDLPVFSKADARQRALARMRDNKASMVKASGTTVGLPELRAGTTVNIQGVGARLSGEYLVTKTTHTVGSSGYVTKFECRRESFSAKERK